MSELDRKVTQVFAGKVVRKDLVRQVKVEANVPVYVLEYLLGKYCATDDPVAVEAGLQIPILMKVLAYDRQFDVRAAGTLITATAPIRKTA